jgi:hypothetical protein
MAEPLCRASGAGPSTKKSRFSLHKLPGEAEVLGPACGRQANPALRMIQGEVDPSSCAEDHW